MLGESFRPNDGRPARPYAMAPPPPATFRACPLLGFFDDPASHASFPFSRHRCFARKQPQPVQPGYQVTYCLADFERCPIYRSATDVVPPAVPETAAPPPSPPQRITAPPVLPVDRPEGGRVPAPAPRAVVVTPHGGSPREAPGHGTTRIAPATPRRKRARAEARNHRLTLAIGQHIRRWLWLVLLLALCSGVLVDMVGRRNISSGALPAVAIAITVGVTLVGLIVIVLVATLQRENGVARP